ncbi:hypothetical protein RKD29_007887 [Streptomyces tendae]
MLDEVLPVAAEEGVRACRLTMLRFLPTVQFHADGSASRPSLLTQQLPEQAVEVGEHALAGPFGEAAVDRVPVREAAQQNLEPRLASPSTQPGWTPPGQAAGAPADGLAIDQNCAVDAALARCAFIDADHPWGR